MRFNDYGIILSLSRYTATTDIIKVFTENHGIYSALHRPGKSRALSQPGNFVNFAWHGRLESHLGNAKIESLKAMSAGIISSKLALYTFRSIAELILMVLQERQPHQNFFNITKQYIEGIVKQNERNINLLAYINFELALLQEAGFGLDFSGCAVTGEAQNLTYISPKTGRAVSASAGKDFKHLLIPLPPFLIGSAQAVSQQDIKNAFALTEYFFNRHIFAHSGKKAVCRQRLLSLVLKEHSQMVGAQ